MKLAWQCITSLKSTHCIIEQLTVVNNHIPDLQGTGEDCRIADIAKSRLPTTWVLVSKANALLCHLLRVVIPANPDKSIYSNYRFQIRLGR